MPTPTFESAADAELITGVGNATHANGRGDMTDVRHLVERLIVQKAILDEGAKIIKETRSQVAESLNAGERQGDPELGFATMSNPNPVVDVVDRGELEAFLIADGKGEVRETVVGEVADVLAVLKRHAPHLVGESIHVPEWAVTEAKGRAKKGEGIPGVVVREGSPSLSVRPSEVSKARARELMSGLQLETNHG